MKLLIIAATHGNELLGIKLYQFLLAQHSALLESIDFVIGNPRAYAAHKRYIQSDLNRSYQSNGARYEEQRAREILRYIDATEPDIVLDMHTTTCKQPNCLIVGNLENTALRRFLRASHIKTVLEVKSLNDIASAVTNVVGYEVPNDHITPELLNHITNDLRRFVRGTRGAVTKDVYHMVDKIYKKDVTTREADGFVNFKMNKKLGFVPIMTGENSYKKQTNYLGFKASAPEKITIDK